MAGRRFPESRTSLPIPTPRRLIRRDLPSSQDLAGRDLVGGSRFPARLPAGYEFFSIHEVVYE
jgi:hypothetical protein